MWRAFQVNIQNISVCDVLFTFLSHIFYFLSICFFIWLLYFLLQSCLFIYVVSQFILFSFFVVICVLYFSYLFLFFSFQVGFIIYILLLFTHFSMWSHSSDLLSCLFQKKKMTYETLRDSNEIGLFNFVESLCTLSIGIQNMNAQDISIDYFKDANSRLKDVILTLH